MPSFYAYRPYRVNQRLISENKRFLVNVFFVLVLLCTGLGPVIGNYLKPPAAQASGGNAYNASDVLGQPDFTTADFPSTDANSFDDASGSALDTVNHRLFVVDQGNDRVLVYNLDASNNLTDKTADFVIGQPDFNSSNSGLSDTEIDEPWDVEYDSANDRLFVVDGSNNRILVFDLSGGITDGMAASFVIGEPDFSTTDGTLDQSHIETSYTNIAFDSAHERLFATEYGHERVTVWDVSPATIHNGEDASFVIGAPDFNTNGSGATGNGQADLSGPVGIAYDDAHQRLFVGDYTDSRIMIYDLSGGITNGMNASNVLCQPDFTSSSSGTTQSSCAYVEGINYDPVSDSIFVQDLSNDRILVFDLSGGITDGMDASAVLGQSDFISSSSGTSQNSLALSDTYSHTFDSVNRRLYVSDGSNNRVLIYNFARITTTSLPNPTLGAAYTQTLSETGSQGSVSYALASGSLPSGLSLSSTGTISGTPSIAGTYNFSIKLKDDNDLLGYFNDVKSYSMVVPGPAAPNTGLPQQSLFTFYVSLTTGLILVARGINNRHADRKASLK